MSTTNKAIKENSLYLKLLKYWGTTLNFEIIKKTQRSV